MDLYKRVMMKKKFDQGKEKVLGFKDELVAKAKKQRSALTRTTEAVNRISLKLTCTVL